MSASTNRTDVTPSTSTKETNTQEQEVKNLRTGILERHMQGEKGELFWGNGYGYGYSSDLNNWPILSLLPSEFASQIHMIMPLHENAVFIVTKDKMVYALGTDDYIMLDINMHQSKPYQLVKVNQLCGKNIYFFYDEDVTFSYAQGGDSDKFLFAHTSEGEVYAWGNNEFGRLGLKLREEILTPTKVPRLSEEHIIEMAFTYEYGIALTKDGKIYNWGECEKLFNCPKEGLPWQVKFDSDLGKITHVSCGILFNMVLTENGNVYSWGENRCGSLGLYDCNEGIVINHPSIISSLKDTVIDKVVCGDTHTLALTAIGELYVWGSNESRQLGFDTERKSNNIPTKLNVPEMGKIVDIFARRNLSAAIDEEQHVYVWGSFYDKVVPVPTLTRLSNMYNIFKYAIPYIILH